MTERESFFSRLKQTVDPAPRGLGAFASPLAAPAQPKQPEQSPAKTAEPLVKLGSLEKKDLFPAPAAAEGANTEPQAAQRRISQLENSVAGLQRTVEEMRADKTAAQETAARTLEQFREEMTAGHSRTGDAQAPELQAAQRRITGLESAVTGFQGMIEELRGDNRKSQETAARTLEQLREEMTALRSLPDEQGSRTAHDRISELESAVSGFRKIIEEIRGDGTSAHEAVGRTLEQLREEMTALRSRPGAAEEQETEAERNRIAELESSVAGFQKIIEEMRGDRAGAHEAIGRTLEQFREEMTALHSRASEAEGSVMRDAQNRISGLESAAAGFQKTIEELRGAGTAAQETVMRALEQLKEEMTALRSRTAEAEGSGRRLVAADLDAVTVGLGLLEGRMKNLEAGVVSQLNERFSSLETAFGEVARKANMAHETAAAGARSVEKLEERAANLAYLENRLSLNEGKFEKLYDLEAVVKALKVSVESLENNFTEVMREAQRVSLDTKKCRADLEPLSHQVKHLTVLFNHFRTEFSFLLSKKAESAGDL